MPKGLMPHPAKDVAAATRTSPPPTGWTVGAGGGISAPGPFGQKAGPAWPTRPLPRPQGTARSRRASHNRTEPGMSMVYLAQPDQQQQLEWLDGGTLAMLLDGKATDGQLMVGRFDVARG